MSDTGKNQIRSSLLAHLERWGLQQFDSDAAYFAWQRNRLSPDEIANLHRLVANKQSRDAGVSDEIAFYDEAAAERIAPVLYSQRYEYYLVVAPRIIAHLSPATSVLDFGCGIGILTTFYAQLFPGASFLGLDRSPRSIEYARRRARELGMTNIEFVCFDLDRQPASRSFDLIVATHALLQAERDPGIPSLSWRTFDRTEDGGVQVDFEKRTGLAPRLDHLRAMLAEDGKMIVFEKTRLLARRIGFQRALGARGLVPIEEPEPIRYRLVEEIAEDGPLYVLGRKGAARAKQWKETPEEDREAGVDLHTIGQQKRTGDEPLYENHDASAQRIWAQLPGRHVQSEQTWREPAGRELHMELGTLEPGLVYLYVANTFDQRQLVIIEQARASVLGAYYQEILNSHTGSS